MSAFIAASDDRAAVLITDGAGYDEAGVVQWLGPKVTVGKVAPIAVTTRGGRAAGVLTQKAICDQADRYGVDYALANFERELPGLAADPKCGGADILHWHIIAWTIADGPVQISAHNMPFVFSDGQQPLKVYRPTAHYFAGNQIGIEEVSSVGIRPRYRDESPVDYLKDQGVNFMEAMRRRPATPLPGEEWEGDQYLIGGQCDVTTVDLWGARTSTVRRWPDVVGEKIVPEGVREAA